MTKCSNRVGKVLNALDEETFAATSAYWASSSDDNEDDIPMSQLFQKEKKRKEKEIVLPLTI
jgi:hypothetical protein